jgi:hypothetical protein
MQTTKESLLMKKQLDELKQAMKTTIIELMDGGGATPYDTYRTIAKENPHLCRGLAKAYLIALAGSIQHSDIPVESARFQAMFRKLNRKYFEARLPDCEVQVVYDVEFWIGKLPNDAMSGYIDFEHRHIFLRASFLENLPKCELAYRMVCLAAKGPGAPTRRSEIKRLRALGVRVI